MSTLTNTIKFPHTNVSLNIQDIIDVRDIIERIEELREELAETPTGVVNSGSTCDEFREELASLESLMSDLKGGNGGDEGWEGDWYPITLIRDSYFETAMDELLEDCGDIPKDLPSYLTITVDYDALRSDYTSVEIDGVTYWYR